MKNNDKIKLKWKDLEVEILGIKIASITIISVCFVILAVGLAVINI